MGPTFCSASVSSVSSDPSDSSEANSIACASELFGQLWGAFGGSCELTGRASKRPKATQSERAAKQATKPAEQPGKQPASERASQRASVAWLLSGS